MSARFARHKWSGCSAAFGLTFGALACGRPAAEWACGPTNLPASAGQPVTAVGIDAVSTPPTDEAGALVAAGRRLQLVGDAAPRDWADGKKVLGPPWELRANEQIIARVNEGGYFGGTLRLLHEAPTVVLVQLGDCRPDMARCDRQFLLVALGSDASQPPQVVRLPDAPADAPALLTGCAGEAHVGVNGHIVSIAESNNDVLRVRISDPVGNAPVQVASDAQGTAAGGSVTNGWPTAALGQFTDQAGELALVRYSMRGDSITSTTVVNPRFNRTGAVPIQCAAPMPAVPRFGALIVTVDFRCTNPESNGLERFEFDEPTHAWTYLAVTGDDRTPLSSFNESGSGVPDWALAELQRSDGGVIASLGAAIAQAGTWFNGKAHGAAQSASATKSQAATGGSPDGSRTRRSCSQEEAEKAVRTRAKSETNPYAELGRATTFVPAGPCSWTVSGIVGWRDMLSNQPVMFTFVAAVSGQGARYTVDLFQVMGSFP